MFDLFELRLFPVILKTHNFQFSKSRGALFFSRKRELKWYIYLNELRCAFRFMRKELERFGPDVASVSDMAMTEPSMLTWLPRIHV